MLRLLARRRRRWRGGAAGRAVRLAPQPRHQLLQRAAALGLVAQQELLAGGPQQQHRHLAHPAGAAAASSGQLQGGCRAVASPAPVPARSGMGGTDAGARQGRRCTGRPPAAVRRHRRHQAAWRAAVHQHRAAVQQRASQLRQRLSRQRVHRHADARPAAAGPLQRVCRRQRGGGQRHPHVRPALLRLLQHRRDELVLQLSSGDWAAAGLGGLLALALLLLALLLLALQGL